MFIIALLFDRETSRNKPVVKPAEQQRIDRSGLHKDHPETTEPKKFEKSALAQLYILYHV